MSYNLNQPMKWAEFKAMPADLKKEYIENLITKHGATGGTIAEMLGISPSAFSHHVADAKLGVKFNSAKRSKEKLIAWQRFVGESEGDTAQPVDIVEVPVMETEAPVVIFESKADHVCKKDIPAPNVSKEDEPAQAVEQKCGMQMNHFSLSFSGNIDIGMVANSLRYIIGNGTNAELKIDCFMGV